MTRHSSQQIILATHNLGKRDEMVRIFSPLIKGLTVLTLDDIADKYLVGEIEESGNSFEENSLIKARTVFDVTGIPALADDSGLEINALSGAPGIYSARYSGENDPALRDSANIDKVLAELADLEESTGRVDRSARFVTVSTFVDSDGVISARGELTGEIGRSNRGNGGFGYDPVFVPTGFDKSLAEMAPEIKDSMSHRSASLRQIAPLIALRFAPN